MLVSDADRERYGTQETRGFSVLGTWEVYTNGLGTKPLISYNCGREPGDTLHTFNILVAVE